MMNLPRYRATLTGNVYGNGYGVYDREDRKYVLLDMSHRAAVAAASLLNNPKVSVS